MPRYFAFLRAINVGSRTVKMDQLRLLFGSFGFSGVETFIASGNVIFHSAAQDTRKLEVSIARQLETAFGFEVAVFVRSESELRKIVAYKPFPSELLREAKALNVAFLADYPTAKQNVTLHQLKSDIDDFVVHDREMYWLCREKQSDSKFSNAVFEKAVGIKATFRGMATVQKLAAKYCV
ncbi:MAG: DUF1697 domain-containing protein [Ignavibacteriales bacterium]|nr:DUF1697 domain-containing protein [Ignavibacteriales bacterium]